MAWVYGIKCGKFIKIGIAIDVDRRLYTMRLYNPHPVRVVLREDGGSVAQQIEAEMHRILSIYAIGREWFNVRIPPVRKAFREAKKLIHGRLRTDPKFASMTRVREIASLPQADPQTAILAARYRAERLRNAE